MPPGGLKHGLSVYGALSLAGQPRAARQQALSKRGAGSRERGEMPDRRLSCPFRRSGSPRSPLPAPPLGECLLPCAWLGYGLPLLLAGAGYLSVFQPALMSNDSLGQWWQMLSGGYTDVAPAFHTMTNWLITRIWFSPAAVAWVQLIAMSLVVAWTLKRLRQWGLTRAWAWAASVLVAIMPAAGILSITLWKDIPYTIAFLILTLWVMGMIQSRGRWLQRPATAFLLGLVLALVGLYRHNGLPVALGTPLLLGIPFYRQGLRLALGPGGFVRGDGGVRGPLYQALAARQPLREPTGRLAWAKGRGSSRL